MSDGVLDDVDMVRFADRSDSKTVQLTRHLTGPDRISAVIDYRKQYSATMTFRAAGGRYELRELTFSAPDGADALTATSVNALPVATLSSDLVAIEAMAAVKWGDETRVETERRMKNKTDLGKRPRPTNDMLELVAVEYEHCQVVGWPPIKRLEGLLGLPKRTAAHWVRLARDRGFLDDV